MGIKIRYFLNIESYPAPFEDYLAEVDIINSDSINNSSNETNEVAK